MSDKESGSRVLIVDDTPKNIQVLGTVLKKENYQINVAQNGLQALDVVQKVKPDLILLDVMMPELDGFETCKRLKASDDTKEIPVIFLTAKTEQEDIIKGFELGAVDYVTKPFNSIELLARVHTHLTLYKLQKRLEQLVAERTAQLAEANEKLEFQVRELEGRDKLVHIQMSNPTLQEAHEGIIQVIDDVLHDAKVKIYRPDADEKNLELKAALGLFGKGILHDGEEMELSKTETISLQDSDSIFVQSFSDGKPKKENNEAIIPVLYGEKALGVIWIGNIETSEEDQETVLNSLWRLAREAALVLRAAQVTSDMEAGDIDVDALLKMDE